MLNNADWATYLTSPVNGTTGLGALGGTNFTAYSTNAITAGVAADNISTAATVGAISSRTINSWALRAPAAATTTTMNGQGEFLTLGSGGLLANTASTVVIGGGRLTAGTSVAAANLYFQTFSTASTTINSTITNNGGGGTVTLIKAGSGTGTYTLNPLPSVWTTATTSNSNLVTVPGTSAFLGGTSGLVVGQSVSAGLGQTAGAIIIGIPGGTTYNLSSVVGTGSTTAAVTTFGFPTTQVLNLTATSASNTISVPAGSVILPGSVVTGAGATLLSNTAASGTGTSVIPMTNTTGVVVGQTVTGTNVPASSTVTAITAGVSVTISNPIVTSVANATALAFSNASLIPANTTVVNYDSGTNTVTLSNAIPNGSSLPLLFAPVAVQTASPVSGLLTAGSNTFTLAPNTLGLNVGQLVTGVTGTTTAASATTASTALPIASGSGTVNGELITGTGIPAGTTIVSGGGTTSLVLSQAATVASGATVTFGATLPANTYVTAYNQGTGVVTLSANVAGAGPTASFTAPTAVSQITATSSGSTTLTVPTSVGMFVGQPVVGAGIPQGATVAGIVDGTHVTLSTATTATQTSNAFYAIAPVGANVAGVSVPTSGTTLTLTAAQVAGLAAGMSVNGFGITPGTTIASISGTTVTLSAATQAVAAGATATLTFSATAGGSSNVVTTPGNTATSATVTLATTQGLYPGMRVTGSGIPVGAFITAIPSATTVTLSAATTSTLTGTALTFNAPATLEGYSNTYTGDTIVNSGTLTIGGVIGSTQVNGNIILYNANLTETVTGGQIAATSAVMINGGGVLTLVGNNTLKSITFNNTGGTATPTVASGGTLTLTDTATAITATNDNFASTPTISGTLELNGANRTVTTSGASPDDLLISAAINNTMGGATAAGLVKAGTGSLVLSSGASTFNGGVQLNNGALIFAANSTQANGIVSSGPAGIGALAIADGTTLLADGTARNVSNAVAVNGNFTFGGGLTGNNLTLGGAISLGSTTRTVTVTNPALTGTLGGTLGAVTATGGAGLTKAGAGVLSLNSAGNNWSGVTTISAGVLQFGAAQVLANSAFVIAAGAELNINAQTAITGSLSGGTPATGGLVTNSGAAATLSIGADGVNASFAGAFTAATPANLSVTKIGTGIQTLTGGLSNATGTLTVNGGKVVLSGAGATAFGTDTINGTGTLSLDNSGTALQSRLGGVTKNININGGTVRLDGNPTVPVTESLGTLTVGSGEGTVLLAVAGEDNNVVSLSVSAIAAQATGGALLLLGESLDRATGFSRAQATATTLNAIAGQGGGANGSTTMSIRSDIIAGISATGSATGFLVQDSVSLNLRPMTTAELAPLVVSSATTNFGNFAAEQNYSANTLANSLTLNTANGITATGGGQAVQGGTVQYYTAAAALASFTLTTGGVFANASATLNTGALTTAGNVQYQFHTVGAGTTLNVNGTLLGTTGGLTKSDAGGLSLNSPEYYTGTTTVNAGTLLLNSGVANTVLVTTTATTSALQNAVVNGGTLDLNGRNQAFGTISNNNPVAGSGGTVTSATAAKLTTSSTTAATFGGTVAGALNLYKQNTGGLTLTNAQTYTGTTTIEGGTLTLTDVGSLASTTVTVNGATLALLNTGPVNNNARISNSALINMNGGTLTLTGANYTATNSTIGSAGTGVTLAGGLNTFTVAPPAAGTGNTAVLNIGNITRLANATAVFTGTGLGSSVIGTAQEFLATVNGSAPVLMNGILGSWATAGATAAASDSWATLAPSQTLNAVTAQGSTTVTLASGNTSQMVAGQSVGGNVNLAPGVVIASITGPTTFTVSLAAFGTGTAGTSFGNSGIVPLNAQAYTNISAYGALGAATNASGNYSINTVTTTGTVTLAGSGNTINSLQISPAAAGVPTLDLNAGTLVVTSGGVLRASTNTGLSAIQNGTLTAGSGAAPAELAFAVNNATATNVLTVSAIIADNTGAGPVTLVKSGTGAAGLTLGGANTYTGGTVVNAGLVNLSTSGANGTTTVAVPGSLIINNGGTVALTAAGEIAATSNVTINGGGVLNMSGSNTLGSVIFNGMAGTATPTVATATALTLSSATPVAATNDNFASTPTISGIALLLSNVSGVTVINVNGLSPEGLAVTAPITSVSSAGGLNKTGGGSLILNAANTFVNSAGTRLSDGTLVLNNAAALGDVTNPLVIGNVAPVNGVPLGILAGSVAVTLAANPVTVNQDFTFGGTAASNNLTIAGTVALSGNRTISVTSPQVTGTISGQVSGLASSLTKTGAGTLLLSSTANNYAGGTTVAGGVLKAGAGGAVPANSALTVNAGAAFDTNGQSNSIGSLSGDTLTTGGLVTNSSTTVASTLTAGNDNTSTTFAGVITNNTAALNVIKSGSGTLTLAGTNSYTGNTTIQTSGTLRVTNPNALGATSGGTSVQDGATLQISNVALAAEPIMLTGTGVASAGALLGSGNASAAGPVTLASASSIGVPVASDSLTMSGAITGGASATLTKSGAGTATISGVANTYGGATIVAAGTLAVTGTLSGTSAVEAGNGGTMLLKSATNSSNIVNTSATFTGNGGTLAVGNGTTGQTHAFASMTLNASSTLDYGAGSSGNNLSFGTMTGATMNALAASSLTLAINNWNGAPFGLGSTTDNGTFGDGQSRLLFSVNPGFTFGTLIPGVTFTGLGQGMAVQFGSQLEIVPVPEPGTFGLLGAVAMCALIGHRPRRRPMLADC